MRTILVTLLLLITAVVIYAAVAEGEGGMNRQVQRTGGVMSDYIRKMSP